MTVEKREGKKPSELCERGSQRTTFSALNIMFIIVLFYLVDIQWIICICMQKYCMIGSGFYHLEQLNTASLKALMPYFFLERMYSKIATFAYD